MESLKKINVKDYSTKIVSNVKINPFSLITENGQWTVESYTYMIIYIVIFFICFVLSLSNYSKDDVTSYGHRFLYALSAGFWNILYLFYYIFLRF